MPYPGVPSEKTGAMERCVSGLMEEEGKSKESAIAICHTSIMGENAMHGLTLLPVTETDLKQWGHDLAAEAIKGELVKATDVVLAHAERNSNGDGITAENIETLAGTLNGMALDLDHDQEKVIGYFINPRQQDWGGVVGGELATDLVVFAGRFPEASEDLQTGKRYPSIEARSSEVKCSVCDQWFQSTANYCEHLTPLLLGSKLNPNVTRWHKNMRAVGGGAVFSPAGAETTFGNTFMVVAHIADEAGEVSADGEETTSILAQEDTTVSEELNEQLEAQKEKLGVAEARIVELEAANAGLEAKVQEHVAEAQAFIVKSRVATLAASGMTEESLKQINDQLTDMDDTVFDLLAEMQEALSAKPPKVEAGQLTIGDDDSDLPAEAFSVFDVEVSK